ncbi:amino acid ABC transporter periplasmic protein [Oleiphilus messinensis]|uniref:Amino acid ABC transporter periplasmic protein n=1 Tax=Oleiphilus messinensis TaxID=141451 RepID=A0A1Y0ID66_9GAMM|nr:transporter substrate-binding domain-containing protein [Oleiphilus messinensis]ARU57716.1 amino acid ABC transporter periplasmic protein [Oleiphilus messinensis]
MRRVVRTICSTVLVVILSLMTVTTVQARNCKQLVIAGGENWYPYFYHGTAGEMGILGDMVLEAASSSDIRARLMPPIPWKRILYFLNSGQIDVVAGALKTVEREQYSSFSDPVAQLDLQIFLNREIPFEFSLPEDLIGKTGAKLRGASFGDALDQFAFESLVIQEANDSDSLFAMLLARRVDYAITFKFHGLRYIETHKLDNQLAMLPQPLTSVGLHVAFSKASKCPQLIELLAESLAQMAKDGRSRQIIERYNHEFSNVSWRLMNE